MRALRALIDRLQPSRVRVCVGAALRRERVAKQPQVCEPTQVRRLFTYCWGCFAALSRRKAAPTIKAVISCRAFLNLKPSASGLACFRPILRALLKYRCCRGNASRIPFLGRFGDRV